MNKYYTSIEQSKKLLELGLDLKTADMYYFLDPTPVGNIYIPSLIFIEKHLKSRMPEYDKGDIPCWSVGALLYLMPSIHGERPKIDTGRIENEKYYVEYPYHERYKKEWYSTKLHNTLVDACYEMVVWLLENGYIKKVQDNDKD